MPRYIDADALSAELIDKDFYPAIVKRAIEKAPTADVVEVVRCKDCEFKKKIGHAVEDFKSGVYWEYTCGKRGGRITKDGFCSDGIRKDGEA